MTDDELTDDDPRAEAAFLIREALNLLDGAPVGRHLKRALEDLDDDDPPAYR